MRTRFDKKAHRLNYSAGTPLKFARNLPSFATYGTYHTAAKTGFSTVSSRPQHGGRAGRPHHGFGQCHRSCRQRQPARRGRWYYELPRPVAQRSGPQRIDRGQSGGQLQHEGALLGGLHAEVPRGYFHHGKRNGLARSGINHRAAKGSGLRVGPGAKQQKSGGTKQPNGRTVTHVSALERNAK